MSRDVVIEKAGVYITRSGRLAFITAIEEDTKAWSGYVLVTRNGRASQEHYKWHGADGACQTAGAGRYDIVGPA